MKRVHILLMVSLLLLSCSKNDSLCSSDSDEVASATQISIAVSTDDISDDNTSRGALSNSESEMGSVGLYCAYTGQNAWSTSVDYTNRLYDSCYNYDEESGEWLPYEDAVTWGYTSITDRFSFNAYSPFGTTANGITSSISYGELVVDYTMPADSSNQPDLMVATPRKDIYPQIGGTVVLQFDHTLCKLGFSTKGETDLRITSVTLNDINDSGTLTMQSDGTSKWSVSDKSTGDFAATSAKGDILTTVVNTDEAQNITTDKGYLFMLPQTLAKGSFIDVETVELDEKNAVIEDTEQTVEVEITEDMVLTEKTAYNFIFNCVAREVAVTMEVVDWDDTGVSATSQGSYLNILDSSLGVFLGSEARIYYSTDFAASSISATYKGIDDDADSAEALVHGTNYFTFPITPIDGTYVVTIKAGSITRELLVEVLAGVITVSLLEWEEEDVDVETQGTYLHIWDSSIGVAFSGEASIYYSTDYTGTVAASYVDSDGDTVSLTNKGGYFLFTDTKSDAEYIVTITAGSNLTRKLRVEVFSGQIIVSIMEWVDEGLDAESQGTYLNILDNSIGISYSNEARIYFSTDYTYTNVTATYESTTLSTVAGNLERVDNYFLIPSTFEVDSYIVTISAGRITRTLLVVVSAGEISVLVIAWSDEEEMGVTTQGTYLYTMDNSLSVVNGGEVKVYYVTDYTGTVTASYVDSDGATESLTNQEGYFLFTDTDIAGTYKVTIIAGNLTRIVEVVVSEAVTTE